MLTVTFLLCKRINRFHALNCSIRMKKVYKYELNLQINQNKICLHPIMLFNVFSRCATPTMADI